jgi:hypothetical protein
VSDEKPRGRKPLPEEKKLVPVSTTISKPTYDKLCAQANANSVSLAALVRVLLSGAAKPKPKP